MAAAPTILDREVYTEPEAARLLRVAPSTLHYWLEGEGGRGKSHQPILRLERRGRGAGVMWAEFVEAGLLREYRAKRVPMAKLRKFISLLRDGLGVPYPLADRRPFVDQGKGRDLLWEAQMNSGLEAEFFLVALAGQQLVLTPPSQSFVDRVEWEGDTASGYRPHDDPNSLVRCFPTIRFGRPSVHGVSTEAIWEQSIAGLDTDEIASTFEIPERDVFWALTYETSVRLPA